MAGRWVNFERESWVSFELDLTPVPPVASRYAIMSSRVMAFRSPGAAMPNRKPQEVAEFALTRLDGAGCRPALGAQPVAIIRAQCFDGRWHRCRPWRGSYGTLLDENGDEQIQDVCPSLPTAIGKPRRQWVSNLPELCLVNTVRCHRPATPDFGSKPVDCTGITLDGTGLQAKRNKQGQKSVAQGKQPIWPLFPWQRNDN